MKIVLLNKQGCHMCMTMENIINIAKLFSEFEFEKKEVENELEAPKTIFYVGDKQISMFAGIPYSEDIRFSSLVILRFVLQGIYDSYNFEKLDSKPILEAINKIDKMILGKIFSGEEVGKRIDEISRQKYSVLFNELCDTKKKIVMDLFMVEGVKDDN